MTNLIVRSTSPSSGLGYAPLEGDIREKPFGVRLSDEVAKYNDVTLLFEVPQEISDRVYAFDPSATFVGNLYEILDYAERYLDLL